MTKSLVQNAIIVIVFAIVVYSSCFSSYFFVSYENIYGYWTLMTFP